MIQFHDQFTCLRFGDDCNSKIKILKNNFPEEYKTDSCVLRAGVFALYRWKFKDMRKEGVHDDTTNKSICLH